MKASMYNTELYDKTLYLQTLRKSAVLKYPKTLYTLVSYYARNKDEQNRSKYHHILVEITGRHYPSLSKPKGRKK